MKNSALTTHYQTISKISEGVYKEKGSKFLAFIFPLNKEDEVKSIIEQLKKEHIQSRHFCYAFRLGINGENYRCNDDGEPTNSAGQPILGQLLSFNITNCLAVVVRYFGGTKLGVGGLVTAYKTAVYEALQEADIIEKEVKKWFQLTFDYEDMPFIMNWIKLHQLEISHQEFELICNLTVGIPIEHKNEVLKQIERVKSLERIELDTY